ELFYCTKRKIYAAMIVGRLTGFETIDVTVRNGAKPAPRHKLGAADQCPPTTRRTSPTTPPSRSSSRPLNAVNAYPTITTSPPLSRRPTKRTTPPPPHPDVPPDPPRMGPPRDPNKQPPAPAPAGNPQIKRRNIQPRRHIPRTRRVMPRLLRDIHLQARHVPER